MDSSDKKSLLQFPMPTSNVDMSTVAELANVLSTAITVAPIERAEYEFLGKLHRMFVDIEQADVVPLNFRCRMEPPRVHLAVEMRGPRDGIRLELSVEEFLALNQGDFDARRRTRFALAKLIRCLSKYGIARDEPYILREFDNLDQSEDEQAVFIAALSHLQSQDWTELARGSSIDEVEFAARCAIPRSLSQIIVSTIQIHAETLRTPQLPDGWHHVHFVRGSRQGC